MPKFNYDPTAEDRRADGRLVIGIADIRGKVGAERELSNAVDLGDKVGLESAQVKIAGEVTLDLILAVITEGMSLDGTANGAWVGECRRCLQEVGGTVEAEVHEVFEARPTEGETYPLGVETVDLEPAVRDAVLLHLPLAPLCDPDCEGPDPERFPTSVEEDDDDHGDNADVDERKPDPRWAALDGLSFDE